MNKYNCSDGSRISQAGIDRRRSEVYRKLYDYVPICAACGLTRSCGTAHLIPQMHCKHLGKTELIWDPNNMVPACNVCNSLLESYKSKEVKKLLCYERMLEFTKLHDNERYQRMI